MICMGYNILGIHGLYINIYAYVRVLILYLTYLFEPLLGLEDRAPWALLDFSPSQGSRARPITRLTRIPKMGWNGMSWNRPMYSYRTWSYLTLRQLKSSNSGGEPSRVQQQQPWFLRCELWWFRMTWDSNNINNHQQPTVGFEWFWWGPCESYVYASIWIV